MSIKYRVATLGGMALLAGFATAAHATPYAYSSNVISGLTITNANGSSLAAQTATTSISDTAQFDGYPISGYQTSGVVGSASSILQAYSGPGPAPAASYTAVGAGNFTGTRSDAAILAGSASTGGVGVRNVAEGYGGFLGNSGATNNAAISFAVVGTGQALTVTFSDLIAMSVATAAVPGETANSSIQNNFSITASGASTPLFSSAPVDINRQISSVSGIPASNNVGPISMSELLTTPTLVAGVLYNIALTSTASETILPGTPVTPVPVPEPASLGLLGLGLLGMGLIRGRSAL